MRNAWTIAKREFAHYFVSPVAYAVAIMFLVILGILFVANVAFLAQSAGNQFQGGGGEPSMGFVFSPLSSLLLFFVPVLTMRLLSEEQNRGTLELLLTAPLQEWEMVLGKWLGAWLFGICLIATTAVYALALFAYGNPDPNKMYLGYLGLILMMGALLAIGVFASSLTSNLIVAVALGYAFTLTIFIVSAISTALQGVAAGITSGGTSYLVEALNYLDFQSHFQGSFLQGVLKTPDAVYFLSVIVLALFLTTRIVEARRWQ